MDQERLHLGSFRKRGQTLTWFGPDNEKNFLANKNKTEMKPWLNVEILYKINDHGFRCQNIDSSKDSLVFLGCSHTFGVGLPEYDTFASHVAEHFNLTNFNLGVPGGSMDTCFRLGKYWIPAIRPKCVILAQPIDIRLEVIEDDEIKQLNPSNIFDMKHVKVGKDPRDNFVSRSSGSKYEDFYLSWTDNHSNCALNKEKNTLALEHICYQNDIPFLYFDYEELAKKHKPIQDYARDLMHYGPSVQEDIANYVIERLTTSKNMLL